MVLSFESLVVKAFNEFYERKHVAAMAYRSPQQRYVRQGFDVMSDSTKYEFYFAIECKSIDSSKTDKLYFSQHFHHSKGIHQLDFEDAIIRKSGRIGFLAVELRRRLGCRRSAFLIPWRTVLFHYKNGDAGLEPEEVTYCTELEYGSGGYHITDEVYESYLNQIGAKRKSSSTSTKKAKTSKVSKENKNLMIQARNRFKQSRVVSDGTN